ncbi:hypothetical protein Ahia01_000648800 [Argonauta hians]
MGYKSDWIILLPSVAYLVMVSTLTVAEAEFEPPLIKNDICQLFPDQTLWRRYNVSITYSKTLHNFTMYFRPMTPTRTSVYLYMCLRLDVNEMRTLECLSKTKLEQTLVIKNSSALAVTANIPEALRLSCSECVLIWLIRQSSGNIIGCSEVPSVILNQRTLEFQRSPTININDVVLGKTRTGDFHVKRDVKCMAKIDFVNISGVGEFCSGQCLQGKCYSKWCLCNIEKEGESLSKFKCEVSENYENIDYLLGWCYALCTTKEYCPTRYCRCSGTPEPQEPVDLMEPEEIREITCRVSRAYKNIPGLLKWCYKLCKGIFCPRSHCVCKEISDTTPVPKPRLFCTATERFKRLPGVLSYCYVIYNKFNSVTNFNFYDNCDVNFNTNVNHCTNCNRYNNINDTHTNNNDTNTNYNHSQHNITNNDNRYITINSHTVHNTNYHINYNTNYHTNYNTNYHTNNNSN